MTRTINFDKARMLYNSKHNTELTDEEFTARIANYVANHKGERFDHDEYIDNLNFNIGSIMYEYTDDSYGDFMSTRIVKTLSDAQCYDSVQLLKGIYTNMLLDHGLKNDESLTAEKREEFENKAFEILIIYTVPLVIMS